MADQSGVSKRGRQKKQDEQDRCGAFEPEKAVRPQKLNSAANVILYLRRRYPTARIATVVLNLIPGE